MIRAEMRRRSDRPWLFNAVIGGVELVTSDQPMVDVARLLVQCGYDPAELLTARHKGSNVDSFQPLPIGEWAKWTYYDAAQFRRQKWKPR